jgi:hypothetical protein
VIHARKQRVQRGDRRVAGAFVRIVRRQVRHGDARIGERANDADEGTGSVRRQPVEPVAVHVRIRTQDDHVAIAVQPDGAIDEPVKIRDAARVDHADSRVTGSGTR